MSTSEGLREAAINRLEAKREFRRHLAIYVLVNAGLIVIWATTGAGYFWPIWPIGGWAIGLLAHAGSLYFPRPISEADIQSEIRRQAGDGFA